MEGGIPCTNPHIQLKTVFEPLLDTCNDLFSTWYRQQHSCNDNAKSSTFSVKRLMTFITRYTPVPGEDALLKHVDGAGKVDGSLVLALHGGGLTFWDGKDPATGRPLEIHYETRSGDVDSHFGMERILRQVVLWKFITKRALEMLALSTGK